MTEPVVTVETDRAGHTVFNSVSQGWAGSGFRDKRTEIKFRRVVDADRNELQVSVAVVTVTEKTSREVLGWMKLDAAQIETLLEACR